MWLRWASLCACAAIGMASTSCGGSGYYEPTPPLLLRTDRVVSPSVRVEPTVIAFLIDLQVPDPVECEGARAGFRAAISEGIEANSEGAPVVFLEPFWSGVPCQASGNRSFDVDRISEVLDAAANSYPSFAVRPTVIYLNNLDLPLPAELRASLKAVRALKVGDKALQPKLWGITLEVARTGLPFDEYIPWTFAGDEALTKAITDLATAQLPQWSVTGQGVRTPLLGDAERTQLVAVKLCEHDAAVETDFPEGVTVVELSAGTPSAWLTLPEQVAMSRNAPLPREGRVQLELCLSNCDRFQTRDGELLRRWREEPTCLDAAKGTGP